MSPQIPSSLDADAKAYLDLPKFHHKIRFRTGDDCLHETLYALVGSDDGQAPLIVYNNGMGACRRLAACYDGIAKARGYRLLAVDKAGVRDPSSGVIHGAGISLDRRLSFYLQAVVAVLDKLNVNSFIIWSHSNGFIYSLYMIRMLPERFSIQKYIATGPFIPCSISGNTSLQVAARLPDTMISTAPHIFGAVMPITDLLGTSAGWSSGLFSIATRVSSSLFGASSANSTESEIDPAATHQRKSWSRTFVSKECESLMMKNVPSEAAMSIAQEAILCLKGLSQSAWGYHAYPDQTDEDILRNILAEAARKHGKKFSIVIVYGSDDGMVPKKGRAWLLKEALELNLLGDSKQFIEIDGAAHDEVVAFNSVIDRIFAKTMRQKTPLGTEAPDV